VTICFSGTSSHVRIAISDSTGGVDAIVHRARLASERDASGKAVVTLIPVILLRETPTLTNTICARRFISGVVVYRLLCYVVRASRYVLLEEQLSGIVEKKGPKANTRVIV
jgi:hypothetical protein